MCGKKKIEKLPPISRNDGSENSKKKLTNSYQKKELHYRFFFSIILTCKNEKGGFKKKKNLLGEEKIFFFLSFSFFLRCVVLIIGAEVEGVERNESSRCNSRLKIKNSTGAYFFT